MKKEEKKPPPEVVREKKRDEDDPLVSMGEQATQGLKRLNQKVDRNEALSKHIQNNPALAKEAIGKIQR